MSTNEKLNKFWLWLKRVIYWLCGCTNNHENPDK